MNIYLKHLTSFAAILLLFAATAGCSEDPNSANAIVQGTVTVDGVLAPRGQVTLYPVNDGPVATGPIHSDGSFSLRIGQGNMAMPDESKIFSGDYIATIIINAPADKSSMVAEGGPPLAGTRLSAIKYANRATTDLKFSIKPGRNVLPIDLEGSQNDPPPEKPDIVDGPNESQDEVKDDSAVEVSDGAVDANNESGVIDETPSEVTEGSVEKPETEAVEK